MDKEKEIFDFLSLLETKVQINCKLKKSNESYTC
jgi:hypothetical protein